MNTSLPLRARTLGARLGAFRKRNPMKRAVLAAAVLATVQPAATARLVPSACPYSAKRIASTACVKGMKRARPCTIQAPDSCSFHSG